MRKNYLIAALIVCRFGFSFQVQVSDSPNNNLKLTLHVIQSAKKSLFVNAYELTSDDIADAIIERVQSGIRVEILQEGQPVPKFSDKSKEVQRRILDAMEEASGLAVDRYYFMTSKASEKEERRFRYNHAKYIIVDEQSVLVGSENYAPTGNPRPNAKKVTRGWQLFIHDQQSTNHFLRLFNEDKRTQYGDVTQLVKSKMPNLLKMGSLINGGEMLSLSDLRGKIYNILNDWKWGSDNKNFESSMMEELSSPDSSLRGLQEFIRSARKNLDLQLMTFSSLWGTTGKASPLVEAVVAAAKRGVKVRVLLNDENAFKKGLILDATWEDKPTQNEKTVEYFEKIAKKEKLKLYATIADLESMGVSYIHNKGALADSDKTLISSINWNRNSVENNRETAVNVSGVEIHDYYQSLFNADWDASYERK